MEESQSSQLLSGDYTVTVSVCGKKLLVSFALSESTRCAQMALCDESLSQEKPQKELLHILFDSEKPKNTTLGQQFLHTKIMR